MVGIPRELGTQSGEKRETRENRELGVGRIGNPARIENSEWGMRESREYIGVRKRSVIFERYFGDVVGFVDLAEVVDLLGVEGVVAYCRRLRRF